jgi:repressor LexA
MSRKQLTSKQHSFLEYLAEHVRRRKVWPTYREIVDYFGYRSPNSVTQNLQALAKKGYLTRDDTGYRLVGQRSGLLGGGFSVQGAVSDGRYAAALSIEEVTLKDLFPGLSDAFAVRMEQPVRGVEVEAGDYLLLEDGGLSSGAMAAVLIDGTAAACLFFQEEGAYRLQFPDGEELYFPEDDERLQLLGRYVGHINRRGLFRVPGRPIPYPVMEGSNHT